jgi:hypothetical protein
MSMRAGWLWSGGGLLLFGIGSCNASSLAPPRPAPASRPAAAVIAPPPAVPRPLVPQALSLTGELTQGGWALGQVPAGTRQLILDGVPVRLAADGRFLIAFDRDSGPAARLVAQLTDGREVVRALTIAPRAWNIEHIGLGPKPGTPPDQAFLRRREGELAQINAARALNRDSDGWRQRFIWPVAGRISGKFGAQRIYPAGPAAYHSGIDIATGTSGTPFVAPADGVVILAAQSPFTLEGRLLMIDHGMGLNSAFLHCSALDVKVGDVVRQGQLIGRIGATGRATGPHLHWSMKWGRTKLDPLLFAGPMR